MRLAALVIVVVAVAGSGCLGLGCWPQAFQLTWTDLSLVDALPDAMDAHNWTVTRHPADPGLPFEAALLPGGLEGNASLRLVWKDLGDGQVMFYPGDGGQTGISVRLDGNSSRFWGRVEAIVAEVAVDQAEVPAVVEHLRNGGDEPWMRVHREGEYDLELDLESAFADHGGDSWAGGMYGLTFRTAGTGGWTFQASLPWTEGSSGDVALAIDGEGHIAGPRVRNHDYDGEAEVDLPALKASTRQVFLGLGLPEPNLDKALVDEIGAVCT